VAIRSVERDGVMVAGRVKDAPESKRGRLGRHFLRERVRANLCELIHVLRSDLAQRAVTCPTKIVIHIGPVTVVRRGRIRNDGWAAKTMDAFER